MRAYGVMICSLLAIAVYDSATIKARALDAKDPIAEAKSVAPGLHVVGSGRGSTWDPDELDPSKPAAERLPPIDLQSRLEVEKHADELALEAEAETVRGRYTNAAKLIRSKVDWAMTLGQLKYAYFIRELNEQLEKRNVLSSLGLHQRPHAALTAEQYSAECELYGNRTLPASVLAMIRAEAIKQGELNDCWFLSTLAVVANEYPYLIPAMLTVDPDGSYTVCFRGDKAHRIKVPPLPSTAGSWAHQTKYGRWPEVIERAAHTLLPDEIKNGGYEAVALQLLTGTNSLVYSLVQSGELVYLSPQGLSEVVAKAMETNQPVLISTGDDSSGHRPGPFVPLHAYSVVAYIPANSEHGTEVVIRNPLGTGFEPGGGVPVDKDGCCVLAVNELHRYFEWLTVAAETVNPVRTASTTHRPHHLLPPPNSYLPQNSPPRTLPKPPDSYVPFKRGELLLRKDERLRLPPNSYIRSN